MAPYHQGVAFSRDDIDKVRQATDLVELFAAVTKVKRSGRSYMAICPFHQEKSPSMSIDPAKGVYHCFGCQKSGDVYTFLQETQGLDFNEAVEELARRAGIHIESDPGADRRRGRRNALHEAVRRAIEVYHQRLKAAPDAGPARKYLRSRGYDADVVDEYKLGYSPDTWDTLVKELRAGGIPDQVMIDAGLARRGRGGRLYDYFRGRVMFPIYDLKGDPVGFGARLLAGEGAKYLNSPDSTIYNKSRLLYGLDKARTAIARNGRSVVVEGYTDVIALHRAGVPEAVATCGTALTEEHFDLLRRFADRVVLAFDADEAGLGAAHRVFGLEQVQELELDVRVAVMPGGDPADLVQWGRELEMLEALDRSEPLIEFALDRELKAFDLGSADGRARALIRGAAILARVQNSELRQEMQRKVGSTISVEPHLVEEAVASRVSHQEIVDRIQPPADTASDKFERALLKMRMERTASREDVVVDVFRRPEHRAAASWLLQRLGEDDQPDIHDPEIPEEVRAVLRLAVLETEFEPSTVLERARRYGIDVEIDRLEALLAATDPSDEDYSRAFNRLIALQREKRRA